MKIAKNFKIKVKTASSQKIAGKIEQVIKLVQRGLGINTAIEQIYGIGNVNPSIVNQVKKQLKNIVPPGGKFPIRSAQTNEEIDLTKDFQKDLNLMNQNMKSKSTTIAYVEDMQLANEYTELLKQNNIPATLGNGKGSYIGINVPEIYIDEALELIDSNYNNPYENLYDI